MVDMDTVKAIGAIVGIMGGGGSLVGMILARTDRAAEARRAAIQNEVKLMLGADIAVIKSQLADIKFTVTSSIPSVAKSVAEAMAQQTEGIVKQTMDSSARQIFECARELLVIQDKK